MLLLDLDSPEALDSLRLMGAWRMVMSFVGIDFGDSESEEGHGKKLEGVFDGGLVGYLREEGVLAARFLVGIGFDGADGTFDCSTSYKFAHTFGLLGGRPLNISLRWPFKIHVRGFKSWVFRNLARARASGFGGPG